MSHILFFAAEAMESVIRRALEPTPFTPMVLTLEELFIEDPVFTLEGLVQQVQAGELAIQGVVGVCDLSSLLAAGLATRLGLPTSPLETLLRGQDKWASRQALQPHFATHLPQCWRSDNLQGLHAAHFPVFVKPVRGSLSWETAQMAETQTLERHLAAAPPRLAQGNARVLQLQQAGWLPSPPSDWGQHLVIETLLPQGRQVTIDGWVQGEHIGFFGMTESFFLANGISFDRFEYPAQLPPGLDTELLALARGVVRAQGLTHSLFNLELIITPQQAYIVELNTRLSMQFSHLIACVEGVNPLETLCEIATGKPVSFAQRRHVTAYRSCISFVLRQDEDHFVEAIPDLLQLEALMETYPQVQITSLVREGTQLSNYRQDGYTFRYAIVDIPGQNRPMILEKRDEIVESLHFQLIPLA